MQVESMLHDRQTPIYYEYVWILHIIEYDLFVF